ncbi:MAG TPA: hypothetical protein PKE29_12370 [Phycisphaerales bacterium]|nr:hypothetical protein [Phycisphaerales bacterium]
MPTSSGFLRPLIAAGIGVASSLAGGLLAFRLFTPARVPGLPTGELLGLLGLILLPLATLALALLAWRASRRRASANPAPTARTLTPTG